MRLSGASLRGALEAPGRALLSAALAEARDRGHPLWLVGGGVRDLALGRPMHDLDLAVDVDAGRFARAVARRLGRAGVEVGAEPRFGTASVRLGGRALDLARLRREVYDRPGALPTVSPTRSIEVDLGRRDFSVNAVALRLDGPRVEVIDPFGGLDDLAAGRLRVLHPRSFEDDATRLWRGARTAAICDLAPDGATAELIAAGTGHLATISGERLWGEVARTALRGRAGRTLALADAWGVLAGTHPALRLDSATGTALARRPGPHAPALLAALLLAPLDDAATILDRLAAPRPAREAVLAVAALLAAGRVPRDMDRFDRLAGPGEARIAARWLDPAAQPALQRDLTRWERIGPHLDAAALQALGVPHGPALGRTLARLRRERYLGILRTRAQARDAVRRWLSDDAN